MGTDSYRESLVNSKMEKGQFKEFNTLKGSESGEKMIIDLDTQRWYTKDERQFVLHKKAEGDAY